MKAIMTTGLWVTVMLLAGIVGRAQDDPVIARVGDIEIHQSEIDRKIEELPPYARTNFLTIDGQKQLLERLVRTKLMMNAALDKGYGDNPDIRYQIQEATERILSSEFFQKEMSQGPMPDEDTMQAYYEEHKDDTFRTEETVQARHIVVDTEEVAVKVKKLIDSGDIAFEKAVDIYSTDPSKESGGDLGVLRRDGFIRGIGQSKPFLDMVFALKANDVSEPYHSRKGWHLVQLVTKQNAGYRPFDAVKDEIARHLLVSTGDIQKEYLNNQDQYRARARCKISHILLPTQEAAETVYEEIQRGTAFEHMVATRSTDIQTSKQGGSLGYLYKGGYVKGVGQDVEFTNAVFVLKQGEISRPIQSRKGWHIVRVDEKEDESMKPLEEVEDQIRQKL
ncbi:peptidyl-prolyl cis-trans isomerase, partial [bacterium]|nr:peptidyl-prolyl cis-trans isomerase [candidate division CSSED10-310 bacterium]